MSLELARKRAEREQTTTQAGRWRGWAERGLAQLVLIGLSAIFIIPFLWMVTASLKTDAQLFAFPIEWIPNPPTLEHYRYGLTFVPFGRYIINTLIVARL